MTYSKAQAISAKPQLTCRYDMIQVINIYCY